jgi:hypothetical protein
MHSSRLAIVVILSLQNNISTHYKADKTVYKYCITTFQGVLGQLSLSSLDRCLLSQHTLKSQDPDPESICGSRRKDDGKNKGKRKEDLCRLKDHS